MWKLFKILWGKERKIAAEGSDESMSLQVINIYVKHKISVY
jgi:hypothetical protein